MFTFLLCFYDVIDAAYIVIFCVGLLRLFYEEAKALQRYKDTRSCKIHFMQTNTISRGAFTERYGGRILCTKLLISLMVEECRELVNIW